VLGYYWRSEHYPFRRTHRVVGRSGPELHGWYLYAGRSAHPLQNVQISINTNITSRIVGPPSVSEALLLIDEPFPSVNPVPANSTPNPGQTVGQLGCLADNNTNCAIISTGAGVGMAGSYNGTAGHYNIFQGIQNGVNAIAWTGVPIDAPGTAGTRVIRITNIRANAFQLGVSSTLVPTQISMIIGVNGSQTISILQPGGGNVRRPGNPRVAAASERRLSRSTGSRCLPAV